MTIRAKAQDDRFLAWMKADGLATSTQSTILSTIRSMPLASMNLAVYSIESESCILWCVDVVARTCFDSWREMLMVVVNGILNLNNWKMVTVEKISAISVTDGSANSVIPLDVLSLAQQEIQGYSSGIEEEIKAVLT